MNTEVKKELEKINNNADNEAICSWCGEIYDKTDLQEELNALKHIYHTCCGSCRIGKRNLNRSAFPCVRLRD